VGSTKTRNGEIGNAEMKNRETRIEHVILARRSIENEKNEE
jgi:hypothetical protein